MKFALHARCEKSMLKQADEIIVQYREKERILDYPEEYPEASVVIQCYEVEPDKVDFNWLAAMAPSFPKGFCVGFLTESLLNTARELGIPAYLLRYINTYAELNELYRIGVSYVLLGQPLFSSLDKVKKFNIPIRWTPNVVNNSNFDLTHLSHGSWIRPEDLHLYDIIDGCVAEFPGARDYKAEQAFFKVYKKGSWPQDLGYLLLEFKGFNVNNYLLGTDEKFGEMRLNCRQRCEEEPGSEGCHYCETMFKLSNPDFIKKAKESQN